MLIKRILCYVKGTYLLAFTLGHFTLSPCTLMQTELATWNIGTLLLAIASSLVVTLVYCSSK